MHGPFLDCFYSVGLTQWALESTYPHSGNILLLVLIPESQDWTEGSAFTIARVSGLPGPSGKGQVWPPELSLISLASICCKTLILAREWRGCIPRVVF